MRFRKLGLVYCPDGSDPKMRAHAMLPTPVLLDGILRVYFASTDDGTRGRVYSGGLDPADPRRVVTGVTGPVLISGARARSTRMESFPCRWWWSKQHCGSTTRVSSGKPTFRTRSHGRAHSTDGGRVLSA